MVSNRQQTVLTPRVCEWLHIRRDYQKYHNKCHSWIVFHLVIHLWRPSPKTGNICPNRVSHHDQHHRKHLQRPYNICGQLRPFGGRIICTVNTTPLPGKFLLQHLLQSDEVGLHASACAELDRGAVKVFALSRRKSYETRHQGDTQDERRGFIHRNASLGRYPCRCNVLVTSRCVMWFGCDKILFGYLLSKKNSTVDK